MLASMAEWVEVLSVMERKYFYYRHCYFPSHLPALCWPPSTSLPLKWGIVQYRTMAAFWGEVTPKIFLQDIQKPMWKASEVDLGSYQSPYTNAALGKLLNSSAVWFPWLIPTWSLQLETDSTRRQPEQGYHDISTLLFPIQRKMVKESFLGMWKFEFGLLNKLSKANADSHFCSG